MHLEDELQRALARVAEGFNCNDYQYHQLCNQLDGWEQAYAWSRTSSEEPSPRLPSVGTAFSFSKTFASNNNLTMDNYNFYPSREEFFNQYDDEVALLCFSPVNQQQGQVNSEQTLQVVNDFDLSLIR